MLVPLDVTVIVLLDAELAAALDIGVADGAAAARRRGDHARADRLEWARAELRRRWADGQPAECRSTGRGGGQR